MKKFIAGLLTIYITFVFVNMASADLNGDGLSPLHSQNVTQLNNAETAP